MLPGAYFQLCPLGVDPWAIYMTSLGLSFPIRKKRLMTRPDLTWLQDSMRCLYDTWYLISPQFIMVFLLLWLI